MEKMPAPDIDLKFARIFLSGALIDGGIRVAKTAEATKSIPNMLFLQERELPNARKPHKQTSLHGVKTVRRLHAGSPVSPLKFIREMPRGQTRPPTADFTSDR